MPENHHTLPRSMWLVLALLTLGWGVNWPMMKMALAEIPVWTFRGLCVAAGALGLFAIARAGNLQTRIPPGQRLRLCVTASLNVTLWNVLIGYGMTMLPSGRAAILAYTMPLWVVLLSTAVLREKLTRRRILGVTLGMSGMALLIGNEFSAVESSPTGAMLVVGAALSWALGTLLMKRYPTDLPTTSFTAWQLLIGGLPVMIGALILDWGEWQPIGIKPAIGLGYNMLIAFVLCHWAWFKIATTAPAPVASLSTLMIPVIGVLSGMALLGEQPRWQEYVALALVIAALATVLIPPRARAI
jgi:drug/metabolite transporter (DMT)-like permease